MTQVRSGADQTVAAGQEHWTLEQFVSALQAVGQRVQALDPQAVNWPLRVTLSAGLYGAYDLLRCQDRPFDRQAFAARVAIADRVLERCPPVAGRGDPRAAARADDGDAEAMVAELYSSCWTHYDDREFMQTVDLFEERFRMNGIDVDFLRGATCLDAGCGSGRYTIAMAKLGARESIGADLSARAIHEARERTERLGWNTSVTFHQQSVIGLPREWTDSFDFVCSNGVAHHTMDPTGALREIFRVLKPGGRAYIFVYGAGGLFWELVDVIRPLVAPIPMAFSDLYLQSLGLPPGKIFNAMDHWYTPIQERLGREEFEARLRACGFEQLVYMPRAKIYDAAERRTRFPEERDLVGEGDLRFVVRKPTAGRGIESR